MCLAQDQLSRETEIYPMSKLQLDASQISVGLENEELDFLQEMMYWREYWTGSQEADSNSNSPTTRS